MALTYGSYLQTDRLLDLQQAQSDPPEHDEMLFIVIHQVYELWFKQVLHEVEKIQRDFSGGDLYGAIHTFKRLRTIAKTLVGQLDILETMTPMSFTSFRDRLDTASGFQSVQFRELEFMLGFKREEMLHFHQPGSPARARLERRLAEPCLLYYFCMFLQTQSGDVPEEILEHEKLRRTPSKGTKVLQDVILSLYRSQPDVAILFELMTDFDEGMQEWRYRHVKVVERTIGQKHGTGGSLGVDFLKKSLFLPIFPDLWAIRHRL